MEKRGFMRYTKVYFLMILLVLLSSSTYAEFSSDRAYQWLISKGENGNYGTIYDTALATMALNAVGRDTSKEISYLMSQRNQNQFCWPKDNCRVKETALVVKVLMDQGINADQGLKWLEDSRKAIDSGGNWYLQVKTEDSGICEIIYTKNTDLRKDITIENGKFTQCNNSTWLNLKSCFDSALITDIPNPKFLVDCNSLDSGVISLIFNKGIDYYLIENVQARQADINLRNDCFGISFKSECNYESSLYASWILKEGKDKQIPFYLEKEYNNANNLHNAFLSLVVEEDPYLKELVSRQGLDGSWNFNVFNTALASFALKNTQYQDNFAKASKWLKGKQLADGSWSGKIDETALVLYAAFAEFGIQQQCFENEKTLCEKQIGACKRATQTCQDGGFIGCDDENYLANNATFYQTNETKCDLVDNDCDGTIDEGCACKIGQERLCGNQVGACKNSKQQCTTGNWLECNYLEIANYQANETKCLDGLDNDCDGLVDLQDKVDCKKTDIVDNPPCKEGFVLCGDGLCRLDCGNSSALCNSNGVCNSGESCNCQDCENQEDSCAAGLKCDFLSEVCLESDSGCVKGTLLCNDGTCKANCGNSTLSCNNNNICDSSESCNCKDCDLKRDNCGFGLYCDFENKICEVPTEACDEGLILCEDGVCRTTCIVVCNLDDKCDIDEGEDSENCKEDCTCGDNICDDREDYFDSCSEDCETDEDSCGDDVCQEFEKDQGICELDCKKKGTEIDELCENNKIDSETFVREEGIDCGGACPNECPEADCTVNDICELEFYEDSENCKEDCTCGDGTCDGYENSQRTCARDCPGAGLTEAECGNSVCETNEELTCASDCEKSEEEILEEKGSTIWIFLVLLLLVGIGGVVYWKYKKPKKQKLNYFDYENRDREKPEYKAFGGEKKETKSPLLKLSREPSKGSAIDKELEKSIEEAKRLIKGK